MYIQLSPIIMNDSEKLDILVKTFMYGEIDDGENVVEHDDFDQVYEYLEEIDSTETIEDFNKRLLPLLVVRMTNKSLTNLLDNPKVCIDYLYAYWDYINLDDGCTSYIPRL